MTSMGFVERRGTAAAAIAFAIAAAAPAWAQREASLCDFETDAEESYSVVGSWTRESAADLVSSGKKSLRVTCAPPESRPGLRIPASRLAAAGVKKVILDVCNPAADPVLLAVRAKGLGGASHRTEVLLETGWTAVEVDLDRLDTGKGGRVDPARLVLLCFGIDDPTVRRDVIFDHVRGVVPTRAAETPEVAGERILARFEATFLDERDETARAGLIETLRDADVPRRPLVLDRLVLSDEDRARHADRAIDVLGGTRDAAATTSILSFAKTAVGRRRMRWAEVAARLESPEAEAYVRAALAKPEKPQDVVAFLTARSRRADATFLPACDPESGGPWQLGAARVAYLRALGSDAAFRPMVEFLRSDHARVRADAEDALVFWTGRELGERPEAWTAWRNAALSRPAATGEGRRYGRSTYYGIPLSPGRSCFVLDVSGSMRSPLTGGAAAYAERSGRVKDLAAPTRLDLAKEELAAAIGSLHPRAVFQMVFFNSEVFGWRDEPVEAGAEMKEAAKKHLRRLGPGGATNLHDAVARALCPTDDPIRDFAGSFDAIYLLTDGQPTAGRLVESAAIVADLRDRNRGRLVKIHTIGFGEADCALLGDLSAAAGGVFVDLSK